MIDNQRIINERSWWEKLAPSYDKQTAMFDKAYRLSIQKVQGILKSDSQVLEIACGTGIISLGIADQVKSIVAVDISPNMIAVAKEKAMNQSIKNIYFQVGDGYSLPYEANSFDVILLFNALHVVKEPNTMLTEICRLLKPDGVLLTATDCYKEPLPVKIKLLLFVGNLMKSIGILKLVYNSYKKSDVTDLLVSANYRIVEEDILNEYPMNYFVMVKKN